MTYTSIRPGKVWLDTEGKPIQAHGFSVFYDENRKRYCWYGENKEHTVKGGKVWTWGVRMYTSPDLYNWTDQGLIIPPTPDDLHSPLHPTYCMDRPHIIYCPKTKKYVAWLKIMAGEISQFMCVLQADVLEGPYRIVHEMYKPLQMDSGDFCLHEDRETGKAYIFFERPHFQLICATLTEDYTGVTGEYRDLGDPCIKDKSGTTFNSQITSVLKIPGKDLYIACADRWMPQKWVPMMSKQIISGMKRHFADYQPDTSPREIQPLPGVESVHNENTSKSRYVWLPIEWEGDMPRIRWRKDWRLADF